MADVDYSDLGFPNARPGDALPENPYDADGYCDWCGNGAWKYHAPWCQWRDCMDVAEGVIRLRWWP